MYDSEKTYLIFDKMYGIVRDYISKPEDISQEQYAALLALEQIRTCMYETETELLKRLIAEEKERIQR